MMRDPASGTQASGAPMSVSCLPFGVSDSALHVQPQGDNKLAQPTHALPMPPLKYLQSVLALDFRDERARNYIACPAQPHDPRDA